MTLRGKSRSTVSQQYAASAERCSVSSGATLRQGAGAGKAGVFPTPDVAALQFDHPSDWGRHVRTYGRFALYDLDFGHGNHIYTFVIWA